MPLFYCMKKILDRYGDVTEVFHFNESTGEQGIEIVQDVESTMKRNEDARSLADKSWKGDLHEVANIPLVVVQQWAEELGDWPFKKEHRKWLLAKLNSRDWLKLRTKEGRI